MVESGEVDDVSTVGGGLHGVSVATKSYIVRVLTWFVLGAAGFGAGGINAVAGGGSLISFPALLHAGMGARIANAPNTVAVWPGSVSAVLATEKHRARVLAWPSLAGGLAGSWLLLHTSERAFRNVVPWLMLVSCVL